MTEASVDNDELSRSRGHSHSTPHNLRHEMVDVTDTDGSAPSRLDSRGEGFVATRRR